MKFVKISLMIMATLIAVPIYIVGGVAFGGFISRCVQWVSDNEFTAGFFGGLGAVMYYIAIPTIVGFGIEELD